MTTTTNDKSTATSASSTDTAAFDLDQWQRGGLKSFAQTCFADYWSDLKPDKIISSKVDPYSFAHRVALGKYLIEHTGGEKVWAKDCTQHWYWGYLSQLDWQRRSGRLEDPKTWNTQHDIQAFEALSSIPTNDNISEQSWWGYMNLQFSVAVYCGAAEAGIVPKVKLSNPRVEKDEGFQECVLHWKAFWNIHHRDFVTAVKGATKESEKKAALVTLYQHLWKTHTSTINSGIAHGKKLEALLPELDRNVGLGWCNMVELLSAMTWTLLSLDALYEFGAGYLPTLRIAGPETVEWIKANRPREAVTIANLDKLKDTPPETMEKMCKFWSRVTRWGFQRDTMPRTLDTLSHGKGPAKMLALTKILTLAIAPHSALETGIWVSAIGIGCIMAIGMNMKHSN